MTLNNPNAQNQSKDDLLVKQNNAPDQNEPKVDMNIRPSTLIKDDINEGSLSTNRNAKEMRVVIDNDDILEDISFDKEDDSFLTSNNSKNSYIFKRKISETEDEDVPKTEKTRDLLFTD